MKCQKIVVFFLHFLGKATMIYFYFLHEDRGQHFTSSGPSVGFQKNNPGISRGLSVKIVFLTFSGKHYYNLFLFFA